MVAGNSENMEVYVCRRSKFYWTRSNTLSLMLRSLSLSSNKSTFSTSQFEKGFRKNTGKPPVETTSCKQPFLVNDYKSDQKACSFLFFLARDPLTDREWKLDNTML